MSGNRATKIVNYICADFRMAAGESHGFATRCEAPVEFLGIACYGIK